MTSRLGRAARQGVTQTGVLELAEAGAAYLELGLGTVGAAHPRGEHDDQLSLFDCGQEVELPQQRPLAGLRSAADLPVLHERWRTCLDSGLVMVMGLRAYGAGRPAEEDLEWCSLGSTWPSAAW